MAGRYAHAKQFKRRTRELKLLHARHGRLICDIRRKIAHDQTLRQVFAISLAKAAQIRRRLQQRRDRKLYSWHAPETESSSLVLRRPLAK